MAGWRELWHFQFVGNELGAWTLALVTFLVTFTLGQGIEFSPSSDKYLSFFLRISVGIGLIFQLPAVLFVLAKIRVVNVDKLRKWRRYAFLVCAIVAAAASTVGYELLCAVAPRVPSGGWRSQTPAPGRRGCRPRRSGSRRSCQPASRIPCIGVTPRSAGIAISGSRGS